MLIIVHENGIKVNRTILDKKEIAFKYANLTNEFWHLAKEYSNHLIVWVDIRFYENLGYLELPDIFRHKHVMASYSLKEQYFSSCIGYIDQLPFVKPDYSVKYPTWRMSTNAGGIYGHVALQFEGLFKGFRDFGFLINAIAKIGQQNSLFCYADPRLLNNKHEDFTKLNQNATLKDLFRFTFQFYKTEWIFVLLFCYIRYERRFPISAFILAFFNKKLWNKNLDLSFDLENKGTERQIDSRENTVDVIIPTLNRATYLKQVLIDLDKQTYKPTNVIIVEQNPDIEASSELNEIISQKWKFSIIHKFIKRTGACFSRNLALNEVTSKWVFFADDDLRLPETFLESAVIEIQRLKVKALNFNCIQPEGNMVFQKIKQWGAFASGSSLVTAKEAKECIYRPEFERGFGEDTDYGLQLRSKGVDIIYHPDVQLTHLKAPRGGFREPEKSPWMDQKIQPKPSPTMMLLVKYHFDEYMARGYMVALFVKYYQRQKIKNPFAYLKTMRKRWKLSEKWADQIIKQSKVLSDEV